MMNVCLIQTEATESSHIGFIIENSYQLLRMVEREKVKNRAPNF